MTNTLVTSTRPCSLDSNPSLPVTLTTALAYVPKSLFEGKSTFLLLPWAPWLAFLEVTVVSPACHPPNKTSEEGLTVQTPGRSQVHPLLS